MESHDDFESLLQQLAYRIKILRQQAGLSQEGLALAAGVDRTYVSQLERGLANPSLLILHRISKVLNTDVQLLLDKAGTH